MLIGPNRCVAEALKRFNAWAENKEGNPIPPPLRSAVWRAAVEKDTARAVQILKKEWFETKSIDGKLFSLSALGCTKDPELVGAEILPFLFNASPPSNAVPPADMHVLGRSLTTTVVGRDLQWQFLQDNYDACIAKLGNPIVVDRFIGISVGQFADDAAVDAIDAFFKDKDTHSFDRTIGIAKDKIRGRAAYKKRDTALLKEWLGANGYM